MNAMTSTVTDQSRQTDLGHFKTVMGLMAVGTVVAGTAIGFLHGAFGLSHEEGRDIASVFLLAGVGDTLVLYFWDRLFGRR